jgi:hypothetical protein
VTYYGRRIIISVSHEEASHETGIRQMSDRDTVSYPPNYSPPTFTFQEVHSEEVHRAVLHPDAHKPATTVVAVGDSDLSQSCGTKRKVAADGKDDSDDKDERSQECNEAPEEDSSKMTPYQGEDGKWRTPCSCPDRAKRSKRSWGREQEAKRHLKYDARHVAKRCCIYGCGKLLKSGRKFSMERHADSCTEFRRRDGMEVYRPRIPGGSRN